jgi:hypothetical protein
MVGANLVSSRRAQPGSLCVELARVCSTSRTFTNFIVIALALLLAGYELASGGHSTVVRRVARLARWPIVVLLIFFLVVVATATVKLLA